MRYGLPFNTLKSFILVSLGAIALSAPAYADCVNPAAKPGAITYNANQNTPQACIDDTWVALGALNPAAGGGSCSNPAMIEGAIVYNNDYNVLQYCDGTNWMGITTSGGGGCVVVWDSLEDVTNVPQSSSIESNTELVTLSGCASADVSIVGEASAEYRICADSGCSVVNHAYSTADGSIDSGEYIQTRMTSGATPGNTRSATITLAAAATEWSVNTANIPEYIARTQVNADDSVININKPAGTIEDDLMIATVLRDSANTNMSAPVGWTQIGQGNANSSRLAVWYKVATDTEPASYTFTLGLSDDVTGSIVTIRNVDTINPINISGTATGNDEYPTAPSVTTTSDNVLLIAVAGADDNGNYTPPAGYTEHVDIDASLYVTQTVASMVQSTSGASGTAIFTGPHSGFDADWRTYHIAVQPP